MPSMPSMPSVPPVPHSPAPPHGSGPEPERPVLPRPRPRAEAVLSSLLAAHVPVSLLLDLASPYGPCSAELLWREPGSADWLHP